MAELSQQQLEEMVTGKPARPSVTFFDKAVLDVTRSREQGRRLYMTRTYVKETFPGVTDWVARVATPQDIAKYREEHQYYLSTRRGTKEPTIDILPGLELVHMQELLDYGLATLRQLAEAEMVPPHLEYAQRTARRLRAALEGEEDVRVKESPEVRIPEAGPPVLGRDDSGHVHGRVPEAGPRLEEREAPQGVRAHRPEHRNQSREVIIDPNFTISFQ